MRNQINMPKLYTPTAPQMEICRPYLAVQNVGGALHTVILGRGNTVLFFDSEDGSITHGTTGFLKEAFTVLRAYEPGEVLSYVQG